MGKTKKSKSAKKPTYAELEQQLAATNQVLENLRNRKRELADAIMFFIEDDVAEVAKMYAEEAVDNAQFCHPW